MCLLLSADRLLGGATEALLRDTDSAYKDITGELYVEYKALREKLMRFLTDAADGPKPRAARRPSKPAQKILDRILFVAFAQRTDLLPDRLLERAKTANNEFVPQADVAEFPGAVPRRRRAATAVSISTPTMAACSRPIRSPTR